MCEAYRPGGPILRISERHAMERFAKHPDRPEIRFLAPDRVGINGITWVLLCVADAGFSRQLTSGINRLLEGKAPQVEVQRSSFMCILNQL